VDWAEGLTFPDGSHAMETWRSNIWEKTLSFVKKVYAEGGLDLFLGYLYPSQIDVGAIRELQRKGIPCVNFFCDNVREFRRVPPAFFSFDLHWVPEFEALPMYRKAALPFLHAPMPCWIPNQLRTVSKTESEPPTFIGSADTLRKNLFSKAIVAGAEILIRGPGWNDSNRQTHDVKKGSKKWQKIINQYPFAKKHGLLSLGAKLINALCPNLSFEIPKKHFAPTVFGGEYYKVTRSSKITLGVNRVPAARRPWIWPLKYSRLRDIEAPMLGACYLTEYTEGVAMLYDIGKEIETYRTPFELVEKMNELLANSQKRAELRSAGQKRALKDHSVPATLKKILHRLGQTHSR